MARSSSKTTQHHHGCRDCRRRYVCGAEGCLADGRCNVCVSGIVSASARAWEPQECCLRTSPLPLMRTKTERDPFRLFGDPWFKCRVCARTFPVQPEQVKTA